MRTILFSMCVLVMSSTLGCSAEPDATFGESADEVRARRAKTFVLDVKLWAEDEVDGVVKTLLDPMDHCGRDTVRLDFDLRPYVHSGSPWAETPHFSLLGSRDQFGPVQECLPGTRERSNYKIINQLNEEARQAGGSLPGKLRVRRDDRSPSGYAVRLELTSERQGRNFFFYDALAGQEWSPNYPQ